MDTIGAKKMCPLIRDVHFFKSWWMLVLFSKMYYFYIWGNQGKWKTSGSLWTNKRKKEMMLNCSNLKCCNRISTTKIYHTNFILIWHNHWYGFVFCSALLSSLIWFSWRQDSSFLLLIGISGSLTCQALLVSHLCRF